MPYCCVPYYLYNAHAYLHPGQIIPILILYKKQIFFVSLTHRWDGLVGEVGIQVRLAQGTC